MTFSDEGAPGPLFELGETERFIEAGSAPRTTILLANPLGPYKYLHTNEHFEEQYDYLKTQGYTGQITYMAINKLHDIHAVESDLYERDMVHGYQARRIDIPERRVVRARAVAVTIHDFDLLREHVAMGVRPFQAVSRRAAVELMLKLTGQPPLDNRDK